MNRNRARMAAFAAVFVALVLGGCNASPLTPSDECQRIRDADSNHIIRVLDHGAVFPTGDAELDAAVKDASRLIGKHDAAASEHASDRIFARCDVLLGR
jgi:hypothetical protein